MKLPLLLVGLGLIAPRLGAAAPPSATAHLDTLQVGLGQPLGLEVRLRYQDGEQPLLPVLEGILPDASFTPFTLDQTQKVGRCTLRVYTLGPQQLPPLKVGFVAGGDTLWAATPAVDFEIVSSRQAGEEGLRDIRPPVAVPGGVPLWVVIVFGVVVLAGLFALFYWWRMRQVQPYEPAAPPPVDYRRELSRISAMGLPEKGEFKHFYSLISELLRRYIEEKIGVDAMEQTTAELSQALHRNKIGRQIAAAAEELLGEADLVKFARFTPDLERALQAPQKALEIVDAADRLLSQRRQGAEAVPSR